VIFEIATTLDMALSFRDVYGMRFVGLEDDEGAVYVTYRVPDPEAPYPQDFVIDQDGIIRYWSWEYDPQEVIATIERLLATSSAEEDPPDPVTETRLRLAPPAPNPFRTETDLRFTLPERGRVRLNVYAVTGGLVRTLVKGERDAGEHVIRWDGRHDRGARVASGVYFIELVAGVERQSRRTVLIH